MLLCKPAAYRSTTFALLGTGFSHLDSFIFNCRYCATSSMILEYCYFWV